MRKPKRPTGSARIDEELGQIAALKKQGEHGAAYKRAVKLARSHYHDVRAQLAAAHASDRLGREHDAVGYYETAYALDVPQNERAAFLIGYGSTLRNVGRHGDAVDRLTEAVNGDPSNPAFLAFLALALHSAGQFNQALATMLDAALKGARGNGFRPYARALSEYQLELTAAADGASRKPT